MTVYTLMSFQAIRSHQTLFGSPCRNREVTISSLSLHLLTTSLHESQELNIPLVWLYALAKLPMSVRRATFCLAFAPPQQKFARFYHVCTQWQTSHTKQKIRRYPFWTRPTWSCCDAQKAPVGVTPWADGCTAQWTVWQCHCKADPACASCLDCQRTWRWTHPGKAPSRCVPALHTFYQTWVCVKHLGCDSCLSIGTWQWKH